MNQATLHNQDAAIKKIADILFQKKKGADELLQEAATDRPHCASIAILQAVNIIFCFSQKTIQAELPPILTQLKDHSLSEHQQYYLVALQHLVVLDFEATLAEFNQISEKYPFDKIAILMMETIGFIGGMIKQLQQPFEALLTVHHEDPDFLAMLAFLYCHLDRMEQAKALVDQAIIKAPHNAWVQHVLAHTIDEDNPDEVQIGLKFMLAHQADWPKQNRFFEGHNWMHATTLMMAQGASFSEILPLYHQHIWGAAKEFNFEQNNAFITLWMAELSGESVSNELWQALASHAKNNADDYFSPYLTITAILSVSKVNKNKAKLYYQAYQSFCNTLVAGTLKYQAWTDIGLPMLEGMLAYIDQDFSLALNKIKSVIKNEAQLGHSDEQRAIFQKTLEYVTEKVNP